MNDNFEPCDWSDCPKACLSLVENGSNVSEKDQVLGSREGNAIGPSVLRAPAEQLRWPLFLIINLFLILVRVECVRCPWLLA